MTFKEQIENILFENLEKVSQLKIDTNFFETFEQELGDIVDSLAVQAKDGKTPQLTSQQSQQLKNQARQKITQPKPVEDKTIAGAVAKALDGKV